VLDSSSQGCKKTKKAQTRGGVRLQSWISHHIDLFPFSPFVTLHITPLFFHEGTAKILWWPARLRIIVAAVLGTIRLSCRSEFLQQLVHLIPLPILDPISSAF
jgi:hypothetical protein